jgi:hypothetical protein
MGGGAVHSEYRATQRWAAERQRRRGCGGDAEAMVVSPYPGVSARGFFLLLGSERVGVWQRQTGGKERETAY